MSDEPASNPLLDALTAMTEADGNHPGGCDECNAEQAMKRDEHGIYHLLTYHDDACPFLRAYEERSGRR